MKAVRITALIGCFLATTVAASQARRSSYDPAAGQPHKQHDSFVDFVLKQINPAGTDYGNTMEEARRMAIKESVQNIYFWTTATCLCLLFIFSAMLVRDDRQTKHREIIAARLLAWYHNSLVESRTITAAAIARNQQLQQSVDSSHEAKRTQDGKVNTAGQANSATETPGNPNSLATPGVSSIPELMTEINQLRQKTAAHDDTEKTLRQQVTVLGRRLQEEKQKNRALKGE
jgi:hypothetical protein